MAANFAGLLLFVHGQASEPFDLQQRPFLLRFNTASQHDRQAAFRELCAKVGVDPEEFFGGRGRS